MNDYNDIWYQSQDGLKLYARDYRKQFATAEHTNANAPTIICIPGLTRNSADFHELCVHFMHSFPIVSVDLRGRGLSEYDPNPSNYLPTTYAEDIQLLIDHLQLSSVVFVGTSLGGFVSLLVAANNPTYLQGLVINDFGPQIETSGLDRIKSYVGKLPKVNNWDEALQQTKAINGNEFPNLTNEQWQTFTHNIFRENSQGCPELNYDSNIAVPFEETASDNVSMDLWPIFDLIKHIPILLIHGELSDIISANAVEAMMQRRPDMLQVEIPNCGHAPLLNEKKSFTAIKQFMNSVAIPEAVTES